MPRSLMVGLWLQYPLCAKPEDAPLGTGGPSIARSNASGSHVWHLDVGEEASYVIPVAVTSNYTLVVRYSNDDVGVGDEVKVLVEGRVVGTFHTQDTRNGGCTGCGWNVFVDSSTLPLGTLPAGQRTITLRLETTDGFGVDIDRLTLLPVPE